MVTGRAYRPALAAALAVTLAGCSMSAFDDRRGKAWSDSNSGDTVSASDYGLAVAGVTTDQQGALITALGVGPAGLGTIQYDETGSLDLGGDDLAELDSATLSDPPTLASAPKPVTNASGLVAVGGLGALDEILLYDVSGGAPAHVGTLSGSDCGAPGTNLGQAMAFGYTGINNQLDLVATRGNDVFLFEDLAVSASGTTTATCYHCRMSAPIDDMSLIEIGFTDGEEIMVNSASMIAVFNAFQVTEASDAGKGCFEIRSPQISNLNAGGAGSRLAVGDADGDGNADVAVADPAGSVFVIPNLTDSGPGGLPAELVAPPNSGAFGSGPVLFIDLDGDGEDELVVGDPQASPEGVSVAGQVAVYKHQADGSFAQQALLYDSAPQGGQRYGRSLGAVNFRVGVDQTKLLVVGASGEVFTLFRALADTVNPRNN